MENSNRALVLFLIALLGGVSGSCSTAAHSTANNTPSLSTPTGPNPPTYLAQSVTCWNSMSCCIQNHPLTPVASCGADPLEAARILEALGKLEAATQVQESAGQKDSPREWKQECIELYNTCINDDWVGTWRCADCLRYCEGQRKWPEDKCFAPRNQAEVQP